MPKRATDRWQLIFVLVAVVCARPWGLAARPAQRAPRAECRSATKRSLHAVVILDRDPDCAGLVARRSARDRGGRYDYDREIVLRGQVFDGVPGVHARDATPARGYRYGGLVNRGFVPAPDAVTAPPLDSLREPARSASTGIALPDRRGRRRPSHHPQTVARAGRGSTRRASRRLPYPIRDVYIRR